MNEKIVVTVRTKNEALNIERFCECYQWADSILVADGGSEDNTIDLALQFPNVKVIQFPWKIVVNEKSELWRNPHGKHINLLIWAAKLEQADWIVFDDCDCVPNTVLQNDARDILAVSSYPAVFAYRVYIKGEDQYFPNANKPGQSIWAWRREVDIEAKDTDMNHEIVGIPKEGTKLEFPYALLHYFYPSEEVMNKKLELYRSYNPSVNHPSTFLGGLEKLPEWAKWENGKA